jgi:hypothetical protein
MEPVVVTLAIIGLGFVTGFVARGRSGRRRKTASRRPGL